MAKGVYIGVANVARKVKKMYIGVAIDVPIYEEEVQTVSVTASNITSVFGVSNDSYYFAGSGSAFTSNNGGVSDSTASTVLTALYDMDVSFTYSYSSENNYDKFTLVVGGTTVESAVSGSTTTKTWSGSLTSGQTISFTYTKDSSQHDNDDQCTFSNMTAVVTVKSQVGTETKSLARKIKKAYIGIGGVARPFWSGGKPTYYGALGTGMSVARMNLSATSIGNYALFGGGKTGYDEYYEDDITTNVVDAFDADYTRTTPEGLYKGVEYLAAASNNTYAIFHGGESGNGSYTAYYTAYDASLTRITGNSEYTKRNHAGTRLGDHALFGGGRESSSVISINSDLTVKDASDGLYANSTNFLSATTIGGYAIFAGGQYDDSNNCIASANAFNSSLTKTVLDKMDTARYKAGAASVGNYALFGGGYNEYGYISAVDTYDTSLTHSTASDLSFAESGLCGVTLGDFALIGGGRSGEVNSYDISLVRTVQQSLSYYGSDRGAVTIGDNAFFAGGYSNDTYYSTVEAYVLV